MNEPEFLILLESRLTRELAGIVECKRLGLWCDGLAVHSYDFSSRPPRVHGMAWICPGQTQQEWRFTLLLDGSPENQDGIQWSTQLPAEDVTRWMRLDVEQRSIEIDPAAAISESFMLEQPLRNLEEGLRRHGEQDRATLVAYALAAPKEELESFLMSSQLWGGSGCIAERIGSSDNGAKALPLLEAALLQLGEFQIELGITNDYTEIWVETLRSRRALGPRRTRR